MLQTGLDAYEFWSRCIFLRQQPFSLWQCKTLLSVYRSHDPGDNWYLIAGQPINEDDGNFSTSHSLEFYCLYLFLRVTCLSDSLLVSKMCWLVSVGWNFWKVGNFAERTKWWIPAGANDIYPYCHTHTHTHSQETWGRSGFTLTTL